MLIVGAKGFAKEILEICHQNNDIQDLVFYDDISKDEINYLYNRFPILKSIEEANEYFNTVDKRFTIGIGNPQLRKRIAEKFKKIGGQLVSTISQKADIGSYDVFIGNGSNILDGVKISNDVRIGKSAIIYYNSIVTHDCILGDYVEISPNVTILGRVSIGNLTHIGAGSTILPDINIGENVKVGAGAVVTKDVPDNCTVVGVPAKVIKKD